MEKKNGKVREIWGRKFTISKNGLDQEEVFSFIGSLIDQNNEYARKLEHLDYLEKLGESTVIEADKEAERIKAQAQDIANEELNARIRQVEDEARAQASQIIAEAESESILQARKIITEAEEASQEKLSAAGDLARDIVETAELEAKRRAKQIKQQADIEALEKEKKAEALLLRSRELAESEIKARFEKVYRDMLKSLGPENVESDANHEGGQEH